MIAYAIAAAVGAALLFGMNLLDAEETAKGIKAGVAVESNPLITFWAGTKPSQAQLEIYGATETALTMTAAICASIFHIPALAILAIAYFYTMALKHYQGYRQWAWLLLNPGKTIAEMETSAWSKIVGFWG